MRVYLLEPYFTGSHRTWAEGYASRSSHEVHVVSLPGQFWKWRLQGGFVTLAERLRDAVGRHGPADVLLATSMLDVAGFLGVARSIAGDVPVGLYLHENQITYPPTGRTRSDPAHGLISWTSVVAADAVVFNSEFHRNAFFDALPGFLRSFPDQRHDPLIDDARRKSAVLPVGIDLTRIDPAASSEGGDPLVLWNHRWDADKDPGTFLEALERLAAAGTPFHVALCGERFARQEASWAASVDALGDRVVVDGHLDDAGYVDVLQRADIVVSTALQEFFGISIVEAIYAGAFPVLPDGLVYRERIPEQLREGCLYRGPNHLVALLEAAVGDASRRRQVAGALSAEVASFDWSVVTPRYDEWVGSITTS